MNIVIPGYDIEGEIGEGAMASVYLATQRSLERKAQEQGETPDIEQPKTDAPKEQPKKKVKRESENMI